MDEHTITIIGMATLGISLIAYCLIHGQKIFATIAFIITTIIVISLKQYQVTEYQNSINEQIDTSSINDKLESE